MAVIRYDVGNGVTAIDRDVAPLLARLPSAPVELCAVAQRLVVLPNLATGFGIPEERQEERSIEARDPSTTVRTVSSSRLPGGVVHELPGDLRDGLLSSPTALAAWKDITPLARNEFICWVEDAKRDATRQRRIRRTQEELEEGQRRPCCWPGCKHRERTGR